jgi:hypothetical protein
MEVRPKRRRGKVNFSASASSADASSSSLVEIDDTSAARAARHPDSQPGRQRYGLRLPLLIAVPADQVSKFEYLFKTHCF